MTLDPKRLAQFLRDAQALRKRVGETPLPIADHNAWVDRMSTYFAEQNAEEYAVRLSDFSGMTFYGDVSERSKMLKSIEADPGGFMSSSQNSTEHKHHRVGNKHPRPTTRS
jgi:hypothetical protein